MSIGDFPYVISIAFICYFFGSLGKACAEIQDKWIPIIVMGVGGLVGIPALYIVPNFPANDVITAIGVGIMSGMMSVAVDQLFKQLRKQPGEDSYIIPNGTLEFGDKGDIDDGK